MIFCLLDTLIACNGKTEEWKNYLVRAAFQPSNLPTFRAFPETAIFNNTDYSRERPSDLPIFQPSTLSLEYI